MGMMELRLVNNSPVLSGNSVAVDYIVSGAVSQVECEVAGSTAVENGEHCVIGSENMTHKHLASYCVSTSVKLLHVVRLSSIYPTSDGSTSCGHISNNLRNSPLCVENN